MDDQSIDGNFVNPQPSQINIDGNCTFQHFSASNPLTSNISFNGNNPTSWLVIFDDVVFTGNMSCNLNSQGNLLWFTNGSTSTFGHLAGPCSLLGASQAGATRCATQRLVRPRCG